MICNGMLQRNVGHAAARPGAGPAAGVTICYRNNNIYIYIYILCMYIYIYVYIYIHNDILYLHNNNIYL